MAEEEDFAFEEWAAEGLKGLMACLKGDKVLPKEFAEHMRAARKERLLAIRSLLDMAIEHAEQKPKRKATKIEVE